MTVINTTAQYAQCNITVLAVRTQDAEIYSYFVPILDGQTDRQTDGRRLNPSWSGVTRGYLSRNTRSMSTGLDRGIWPDRHRLDCPQLPLYCP